MMPAQKAATGAFTAEAAEALLNGSENYTEYLSQVYLLNLLKATDAQSPLAYRICGAFENYSNSFGFLNEGYSGKNQFPRKAIVGESKRAYPTTNRPIWGSVDPKDWAHLVSYFEKSVENFKGDLKPSVSFENLKHISEILHLGDVEKDVLNFLHVAYHPEIFAITRGLVGDDKSRLPSLISRFINHPLEVKRIFEALGPNSPLVNTGILELSDPDDTDEMFPKIDENIRQVLLIPNVDKSTIVENVLGSPTKAELSTGDDFSYLAKEIEFLKSIIKNAVKNGEKGVNILLHGPAGSGKTELSKAIAAELGLSLYSVGETDEGIEETSAQKRVGKLLMAHSFLKDTKDTILLFDEIEDLLNKGTDTDKKADTFSKIVVNRLIENNPVVTIWAGNDPEKFHDSVRQRFTYSLYVDYPPVLMRKKVWDKQLSLREMELPKEDIAHLARKYQAPPRIIANAIKSASLSDKSVESIELSVRASSLITYGGSDALETGAGVSDKFKLELLNYGEGKENYVGAIIASGSKPRPYSLVMRGVPGSGLASMSRYLAEVGAMNPAEADMRALTASNPFASPEKKIRDAFRQAADSKNILIVSNLDVLSENPEKSNSRWQNAGLTSVFMDCLYHHNLPVIATIYNPDRELPEFMRDAFTLDLKFQPLSQDQCALAYETYFGDKPPTEMQFPNQLVPGDFAKVAKIKSKNLNGGPTPEETIRLLASQIKYRDDCGHKVGFG